MNPNPSALEGASELYVRQSHELAELFGFETRNKYAITTPDRTQVAFAAEQQRGILGFLLRQFLGHWRPFEIHFMCPDRRPLFRAVHPFRFLFQRLEVFDAGGRALGAIQQRFALLTKRFDVLGPGGEVLLEMRSGLFKLWTFPFFRGEEQRAVIEKKWGGALGELFTDKDNFRVRFQGRLTAAERTLILAAAIFVDLQYFERKAG
ncbi:MAG: phospholipid scramblase family protein [Myxococcota bacterium]|nr:phospholipid scramblase family protein [Myxococcota bacterium]